MNDYEFQKLEIKNFMSVGNIPITIDFNKKVNFVTGRDEDNNDTNGIGKSVIFRDALYYALTGEIIPDRDINLTEIINNKNKKDMYVKLILKKDNDEIVIFRSRKPDNFWYSVNGEVFKKSVDNQKELNKILDISYDIFSNILIVNASQTSDILKSNSAIKLQEKFEKIFFKNLIFRKILENSRKELNDINRKINNNLIGIEEKQNFILKVDEYIKKNKEEKEKYELLRIENQNKIDKLKIKISLIDKGLENNSKIKEIDEKLNKINIKKNEYQFKINTLQNENNSIQKNIDLLTLNDYSKLCPFYKLRGFLYCQDDLKNNDNLKIKLEEFKTNIEKNNKINDGNKEIIKKLDDKFKEIDNIRNIENERIKKLNDLKIQCNLNIHSLNSQISISNSGDSIIKDKNEYIKEIEKLTIENENYKSDVIDLELINKIFDPNDGILKFFIKKVVNNLNKIIFKYIKKLDLYYKFWFDDNLRLKFDNNDKVKFSSFSSGQQKLINFVILFSLFEFFYDILDLKVSIWVIDEIMDTTISDNKIDIIFNIIKEFNKEKNIGIYLLSHNINFANENNIFDNIIYLKSVDRFTILDKIVGNK